MILKTRALVGLETLPAVIDAQVERGEGPLQIIGSFPESEKLIPEHSLRETRVRVVAALSTMGVRLQGSVDVQLPAGASLCEQDLAIALACLEGIGVVELPGGLYARAELELGGALRPVCGCFAALVSAKRVGVAVVARHDRLEAEASGQHFIAHQTLADVASAFPPRRVEPFEQKIERSDIGVLVDSEAAIQVMKAALEGRDILLLGRPGSGRMILARYYHSLLELTKEQAATVMALHSTAGILDFERFRAPFRAPHHSVSAGGMFGAGERAKPGEVSLATHGVLLLDDLPEFRTVVLQDLKQVRKSGKSGRFPASFRLVATANTCPRDCRQGCNCPGPQLERYRERLALVGDLEVIRLP